MQMLSFKNKLDDTTRDKKLMEEDLYASRDQLKDLLKEKISL